MKSETYVFPTSFAQRRLWFLDQWIPGTAIFNVPLHFRMVGPLNVEALERSLLEIIRRHETLRTSIRVDRGEPVQIVRDRVDFSLEQWDISGLQLDEQKGEIDRQTRHSSLPFDVSRAPLFRASLLRIGAEEHLLLLTTHHLVSDGWSLSILFEELSRLYNAYVLKRRCQLPHLPIQYADFVAWQREHLQGEGLAKRLDYWKRALNGAPPLLELPTDRPRQLTQNAPAARYSISLDPGLVEGLMALGRQNKATLFMTMLAALSTLFYRYSGQNDIVLGTTVANRRPREVEGLIGLFVNALAIRTRHSNDLRFLELLHQVRANALDGYANEDLPFEFLVDELQPERDLRHTPIFQVMFVLQNAPQRLPELRGLEITPLPVENTHAQYDITVWLEEVERGIEGWFEYDARLFNEATIARLTTHYHNILEQIATRPEQRIGDIPILSTGERHKILSSWNRRHQQSSTECQFTEFFEAQVDKSPARIASIFQDRECTYRQLNSRANRAARVLIEHGVGAETLVVTFADRGLDYLTAIIAVLKAGGAFLPLSPDHPNDRAARILMQCQAPVALVGRRYTKHFDDVLEQLPGNHHPKVLSIEKLLMEKRSATNLPTRYSPDNIANVFFTSGSTGHPKGAVIQHNGMLNHILAKIQELGLSGADIVAQDADQTFDIWVWQSFAPLMVGGCVHVFDNDVARDPIELLRKVAQHGITVLEVSPSVLAAMMLDFVGREPELPNLSRLRRLLSSGEALTPTLCLQWFHYYPHIPLLNMWGATECSDDVTHAHVRKPLSPESVAVPVGTPIRNASVYILDSRLQPVPIGVIGELYIGGICVGRGYLTNPARTAEAFLPDPFGERPGSRLYRSGDLGRYLPDGEIEFVARADDQVKIRGFRVEPGEIEATLAQQRGVAESVVLARDDLPGGKQLVAYVLLQPAANDMSGREGDSEPSRTQPLRDASRRRTVRELREFCARKLPDYMIPAFFVLLDRMPLTSSGKVDRNALPMPDIRALQIHRDTVQPRNAAEDLMAGIWCEVLGLDEVGVHDDFFELGGHSLLATQVISRIREAFKTEISLRQFFARPTIASVTDVATKSSRFVDLSKAPPIELAPRNMPLPLSLSQEPIWRFENLLPGTPYHNVANAVRISGPLDVGRLQGALNAVIERHEILRTTFGIVSDQAVQHIAPELTLALHVEDIRARSRSDQDQIVKQIVSEEALEPFDLAAGPLLRAGLIQLDESTHVLVLAMHHIIDDGWSMGIFTRELAACYEVNAGEMGLGELPDLQFQYADFAYWQRLWIQSEAFDEHLRYWKRQLGHEFPELELPTSQPRTTALSFQTASHPAWISAEVIRALTRLSRKEGVTLFMTLLAGLKAWLYGLTGQEDIRVGTLIANRNRVEFEEILGLFVNTLILRTSLEGKPSFRELMHRVRDTTLAAYTHQDIPFEALVAAMEAEYGFERRAMIQVLFVLQDAPGESLEFHGLELTPLKSNMDSFQWKCPVTTFDLVLILCAEEGGMRGRLIYKADLFTSPQVAQWLELYQGLLERVGPNGNQSLTTLLSAFQNTRHDKENGND